MEPVLAGYNGSKKASGRDQALNADSSVRMSTFPVPLCAQKTLQDATARSELLTLCICSTAIIRHKLPSANAKDDIVPSSQTHAAATSSSAGSGAGAGRSPGSVPDSEPSFSTSTPFPSTSTPLSSPLGLHSPILPTGPPSTHILFPSAQPPNTVPTNLPSSPPFPIFLLNPTKKSSALTTPPATPTTPTTPSPSPPIPGSADMVRLLLSYKPDLNQVSFIGTAAVHWAVWPNRPEILELLLQAGADKDHQLLDGSTLLHCAVKAEHKETVECLLRFGADPQRRNDAWQTPLQVAEEGGCVEIARMLREATLRRHTK
ncbi:hypothetical protein LTR02_005684 [Friedmanniomyces endolithicus]|nr:hypothetical protein LTR02_005684 [Friedmanniomyces endolithicus]